MLAWGPLVLACAAGQGPRDSAGSASGSPEDGATTGAVSSTEAGSGPAPSGPDSTGADGAGTESNPDGTGGTEGTEGTSGVMDPSSSSGGASGCVGEPVVHFVYFVEADQVFSDQQRSDIEDFAFEFQQYWFEQLGSTFYLAQPVVEVIMADHESGWYVETADGIHGDPRWYRLGNIKNEVYAKLGIDNFDPLHRVVNYPIARFDGRVGVNFGGAWMDGDDMTCIPDDGPTFPYDDNGPAHCMGHVAHEFGHVLGLAHEGPEQDCMQFGFYDSVGGTGMCDFYPDNVAAILDDPQNAGWLNAEPGETCVPAQ